MRVLTGPFLAMLADLAHTAGKDRELPGLMAIELHTSRGTVGDEPGRTDLLAGASTDRFCAGHTYVACDGQLGGPVLVPTDEAKAIVDVFKRAGRNPLHAVTVHHDTGADGAAGTLRIAEDPNLIDDGLELRVTLHALDEFPLSIYRLIGRAQRAVVADKAGVEQPPTVRSDFSPGVLRPFVEVAKRRREPLRMYRTHQYEALHVQIGAAYRGMAMPVAPDPDKPADGDPDRPDAEVHLPDGVDIPEPPAPGQQPDAVDDPDLFAEPDDELVDA